MLIPLLPVCHRCPFAEVNQPGFKGGACACLADPQRRDIKVMAKAGDCPRGRFAGGVQATAPAPPAAASTVPAPASSVWGWPLWRMLHTATGDTEAALAVVSAKLPCGDCKRHWRELLKEIPPVHGDGWFEWSVLAHNAVNRKLGKPELALEEARAIWSGPWCGAGCGCGSVDPARAAS